MSLERILKDGRDEFNRRVASARKAKPALELDSLQRLLQEGLSVLVAACESTSPDQATRLASEGFDLALRLAALGPMRGGYLESVLSLWRSLARRAPDWCDRPGHSLGRVTAALLNFRAQTSFRFDDWVEAMGCSQGEGTTLDQRTVFLGWTCGYPALRENALAVAKDLPNEFLAMALQTTDAKLAVQKLKQDRWWGHAFDAPKVACKLGGFEGADGLFSEPPICYTTDGRIEVYSAGKLFRLYADRFGACLFPLGMATPDSIKPLAKSRHPWSDRGLILPSGTLPVSFPKDARQSIEADGIVAIWSRLSFWVWVVAP
jgi:hypothetical protein